MLVSPQGAQACPEPVEGARRLPQRRCLLCRRPGAKGELVRLVRGPQGGVRVDLKGKSPGRGAYLCRDGGCWPASGGSPQALWRRIEQALRAPLSGEERQALQAALFPSGAVAAEVGP